MPDSVAAVLPDKKKKNAEPMTAKQVVMRIVYIIMRMAIAFNVVCIFFSSLNPARLSTLINKNLSLFSCGLSFSNMTSNFGRAFRAEWVQESTFRALQYSCILVIVAVVVASAGACMSLGNNKLKKLGLCFSTGAGVLELIAMLWIKSLYTTICEEVIASDKIDKVSPQYPTTINQVYIAFAVIMIVGSAICFVLLTSEAKEEHYDMEPRFQLFLMMLPVIVLAFVFSYLPLYGWRYAFFDYKSGETLSMDKFVGFKWFTQLLQNSATKKDILNVLKNTFAMSGLGILTSWVPLAFAIFLSEIKNTRFRRIVQTFTTIPNFISWVLVYAIALAIFSTDGFINTMINSLNTDANVSTNYLMSNSHMWLKMLAWGLWKGVGWSAIIYIAAISGIDQSLYEAAVVDGAGRFAKMWYITVPELIPTYCVLLLMSVANILSNGMDQYLVFQNALNTNQVQVLDLYVYTLGIGSGLIPLSTVIGMLKSIISVFLLFVANGVSKAIRGQSIV